jgi:dephospho-CoA kinase
MKKLKPQFEKLSQKSRLYNLPVPIIGLTGGIATGKSTVAKILTSLGLPLIDADQLVKLIYQEDSTKEYFSKNYPEVILEDAINFPLLREKFFNDPKIKNEIENFIYQRLPGKFLEAYRSLNNPAFVFYDVPLLFEKKLHEKIDLCVLVYAPKEIQKIRLQKRDGSSLDLVELILSNQMNIDEKKKLSDFIIDNSGTEDKIAAQTESFLQQVLI